jgi:hypothetical protein
MAIEDASQAGGASASWSTSTVEPEPEAKTEETEPFETLLAREDERRRLAREAEEQHQQKTTEETNVLREKNRREFVQSEQGAVAASNAEAERLMHLPTPEYHKLMGSFITDPDKPFGGPDN